MKKQKKKNKNKRRRTENVMAREWNVSGGRGVCVEGMLYLSYKKICLRAQFKWFGGFFFYELRGLFIPKT